MTRFGVIGAVIFALAVSVTPVGAQPIGQPRGSSLGGVTEWALDSLSRLFGWQGPETVLPALPKAGDPNEEAPPSDDEEDPIGDMVIPRK